jgi:leader peptidase (prepilin peptidase)/N-methyltransferase
LADLIAPNTLKNNNTPIQYYLLNVGGFGAIAAIFLRLWIPGGLVYWEYGLGGLLGLGLPLLLSMMTKGGIGGGDIKLFAVIGLFIGWQGVLLTFVLASLLGSFGVLVIMAIRRFKWGTVIPFGPSISLAAFLSYLYGNTMAEWYYISFLRSSSENLF